MATNRQIDANRRNAELSTGPRTEEGKARSSQNALKHCVYAKDILLYWEDFDGYDAFRYQLMVDWEPRTAAEVIYVDQVVQSYFLSRRAVFFMQDAYDAATRTGKPVSETYPNLMRMKTQNDRIVHKSLEALAGMKKVRQQEEKAAAPDAQKPDTANKPDDLAETGFVPPIYEPAPDYCRQVPTETFTSMGSLPETS